MDSQKGGVAESAKRLRQRCRVQIPEKNTDFQKHFEYFLTTLAQACIQHDEIG